MGCGACAAVLVPVHGEEYKYHDSKAVCQKVTSVTCESEGIVLGLELSVNYFRFCKYRQQRESVYICCDCTVAIDIVIRRLVTARLQLWKRLTHLEDLLSEMMVNIILVWIPAHQGISFHDTADGLARDTAHSIFCLLYTSDAADE